MNIFELKERIFQIKNQNEFEQIALEVFRFQAENVPTYKKYLHLHNIQIDEVKSIRDIRFLPIELFKYQTVTYLGLNKGVCFQSSGTGNTLRSKHFLPDMELYEASFFNCFELFLGSVSEYVILALLPSYLENGDSSLVYMVDKLIQKSGNTLGGFYLNNFEQLFDQLQFLKMRSKKTLLLGVSYALLDFGEQFQIDFPELIIVETGGMKGRKKEITRLELHEKLSYLYKTNKIYSEYGMTELLSQAWMIANHKFQSPPWMKVLVRDPYDPFDFLPENRSGGINVVDLCNLYSCSFIETSDLGKVFGDGFFEVSGRIDHIEIRGCNLLYA